MRKINLTNENIKIVNFIKNYVNNAGMKKGIVGLSGGLDSSLIAHLCVESLGKENVIGVMMPYKSSSSASLEHGKLVAENLGIQYFIRDISPMVDIYFDNFERNADQLRRGNFMARVRMCVLYDISAKENALVIGTGNKTELYLGYCTQFGDSACAIEPIGHLYKNEVRKLSQELGVPQEIIDKKPTADLWEGQTDEDELGISYETADKIIYYLIDQKINVEQIIPKGFSEKEIQLVKKLILKSEFKRKMPPSP